MPTGVLHLVIETLDDRDSADLTVLAEQVRLQAQEIAFAHGWCIVAGQVSPLADGARILDWRLSEGQPVRPPSDVEGPHGYQRRGSDDP